MKWIIALVYPVLSLAASNPIVATLNEEPIFSKDYQAFVGGPTHENKESLDRYLTFRLAVQDAKKLGLADRPEIKLQIEKLIYQAYLDEMAQKYKADLEISTEELKRAYIKEPMIRAQHLALRARNKEEQKKSEKTARNIVRAFKKGQNFTQLVLNHSIDPAAHRVGDLDYRGSHNLHTSFYKALNSIKDGEITKPILHQEHIHLFVKTGTQSFTEAPQTYRAYLKGKLKREKELAILRKSLDSLKAKSKISYKTKEQP